MDRFLAGFGIDRDDFQAAGEVEIIRVLIFMPLAALHRSRKAVILAVNPVGAEFDLVFVPRALGNVVGQNVFGFVRRLGDLDVALQPSFFVKNCQGVFVGKKMVFGRDVVDRSGIFLRARSWEEK